MLGLPKSTEFNKRIPKKKFCENLLITPAIKKAFTEQINIIYWRNKLAVTTLNLAEGKQVAEIEVIELRLNTSNIDDKVLFFIDRALPYHILFLLEYDGKYQAVIGYKEDTGSGKVAFKVEKYYRTAWLAEEELLLHLEGLSIDAVYENFIRQIAGGRLVNGESTTLKKSIEQQMQREQVKKQITALESKMKKEKQLNRQMELKAKIKTLQLILKG